MVELDLIEAIGVLGTAFATIALVFLLYRTVKQLDATVNLNKIQTDYRFRPWIGPLNSINALPPNETQNQYDCTIKNYGEIPAQYVKAYCRIDTKLMDRVVFKKDSGQTFNFAHLLNMEKHYWWFIDKELVKRQRELKKSILHYTLSIQSVVEKVGMA